MNFVSHSQAGQDLFVYKMLVEPGIAERGLFLDIGCAEPIHWNNTYGLEQIGWWGMMMDSDPNAIALCKQTRGPETAVVLADVTKIEPQKAEYDYLSLDVDAASLGALEMFLRSHSRFRVATIEHDFWRFGAGPRAAMRKLLKDAGYQMLCQDVSCTLGNPFEDWYIDPQKVSLSVAYRFQSVGEQGAEIALR